MIFQIFPGIINESIIKIKRDTIGKDFIKPKTSLRVMDFFWLSLMEMRERVILVSLGMVIL